MRRLRKEPKTRRLVGRSYPLRRRRILRRHHGAPGAQAALRRHRLRRDGPRGRLQGRSPVPFDRGLRSDDGALRGARGLLRLGDAAVQHDDLHGPTHAQYAPLLRSVRARNRRGAHQGQVSFTVILDPGSRSFRPSSHSPCSISFKRKRFLLESHSFSALSRRQRSNWMKKAPGRILIFPGARKAGRGGGWLLFTPYSLVSPQADRLELPRWENCQGASFLWVYEGVVETPVT